MVKIMFSTPLINFPQMIILITLSINIRIFISHYGWTGALYNNYISPPGFSVFSTAGTFQNQTKEISLFIS